MTELVPSRTIELTRVLPMETIVRGDICIDCGIPDDMMGLLGRLALVGSAYSRAGYAKEIPIIKYNCPFSIFSSTYFNRPTEYKLMLNAMLQGDKIAEGVIVIFQPEDESNNSVRMLIDPYESSTVPVIVRTSNGYVCGSARLILSSDEHSLPACKYGSLDPNYALNMAEFSQLILAVSADGSYSRSSKLIFFALLRAMIKISSALSIENWAIMVDAAVMRSLNQNYKIGIKSINLPTVSHLGEGVFATIINIKEMLESIGAGFGECGDELVRFLKSETAEYPLSE